MTASSPGWYDRLRRAVAKRTGLPRNVIVLAIIAFFVMVGFGVVIPVLPVYAGSFGVGQFWVGLVVSSFAMLRLATSPFTGPLISALGERLTLGIGMVIVAASSVGMGLSTNYWQLLLTRAGGGIGSAMFTVSAMTLLINTVAADRRGRAVGTYQSGFLLGGMAGPALGGLLAKISLTAPFFFYAVTLLVAGAVGLILLRPVTHQTTGSGSEVKPFGQVLRDKRYQAALMSNFSNGWTSMGVRSSLTPVLVVSVLHRDPVWTGIALAVAAVVQTLALGPAGRFVDRAGRRPAAIMGPALAMVAIMVVAIAPNIWVLILALAAYGVAGSMLGTAPAASVGDAAGGRGGTPVAVFSMMGDVGQIVGPLVAGWLWDTTNPVVAFGVGAALWLITVLMAIRMPNTRPGSEDSHAATAR
ncbi:MFS transporter [Enemella sp. A6]|uniref:MFS transporter n=1 Tax=Enemella sp. A6 TaxID=3440152 RepID=UPI003EBDA20B